MKAGIALTETCYEMYHRQSTGLAPEYARFNKGGAGGDIQVPGDAPHYILRPETVESFFILHQLTKDEKYVEWGWEVFNAIERHCKTEVGFGGIRDVRNVNAKPDNRMESFFLAETMKYLYLLFDEESESKVNVLTTHVFNTEAHPMRRIDLF